MASLGSIFVDLLLDDSKFVDGTKRSSKAARDMQKQIDGVVAEITTALAAIGFTELIKNQIEAVTQTQLLAKSLGVATDEFQALTLVAREAGVAQDQLAKLFGKSEEAIVKAAQGGGSKPFDALGLSVKNLLQLSPDKQFEAIATALSKVQNPTVQVGLAMEIFGKTGRDVINILPQFSEKLAEAESFQKKFNIALSDVNTQEIKEAGEEFRRVQDVLSGFLNTILIQIAPVITGISQGFIDAAGSAQGFGEAVNTALKSVGFAIDLIRVSLMGIEGIFDVLLIACGELNKLLEQTGAIFFSFIPGVNDALAQMSANTSKGIAQAGDDLTKLNQKFQQFKSTGDLIKQAQTDAAARAKNVLASVPAQNSGSQGVDLSGANAKAATAAMEKLKQEYADVLPFIDNTNKATEEYQKHIQELKDVFDAGKISYDQYNKSLGDVDDQFQKANAAAKDSTDQMSEFGKQAAHNIQDAFAQFLFDPFKGGLAGMVAGFADAMRKMLANAAAENLANTLFGSLSGNKGATGGGLLGSLFGGLFGGDGSGSTPESGASSSVNWNAQPHFATGGYLPAGQWGVAGENGPEPIYGGMNGMSIIPNDKIGSAQSGNQYYIDAKGADQSAIARLEKALFTLAGPGVVEKRVVNAQRRGKG